MSNFLRHTLPFTAAAAHLVGLSFDVAELKTCGKDTLAKKISLSLVDFVTVVAIAYNAALIAQDVGLEKATILGALMYILAVLVPRVVVEPTLDKFCKPCPASGRFGVGFVALVAIAIISWLTQSAMLLG